jgi:hypothetical protein
MNLYQANRQWAERPSDERFRTIQDLYTTTRGHFDTAGTVKVQMNQLSVVAVPIMDTSVRNFELGDLLVQGPEGTQVLMTNYSFRQICNRIGARGDYLATLPAHLAADCMNYGFQKMHNDVTANLLFHQNGQLILRAATSEIYHRIWNWQVAEFLQNLHERDQHWRVPPARPASYDQPGAWTATAEDVKDIDGNLLSLTVREGDTIAPAGLYASDHDCFAFLVNMNRSIEHGGDKLVRGFFVENSEVGAASLKFTCFLFNGPCGNHIAWGVDEVVEVSFRHVGSDLQAKMASAFEHIATLADRSTDADAERIDRLKAFLLGEDKPSVIQAALTAINRHSASAVLTRKAVTEAYDLAVKHEDVHGAPNSAWGIINGLTRLSQQTQFTDARTRIDQAAATLVTSLKF